MIYKPKADKIKKDMMELWKNTFHDSNRYIKLVFDTYFTLENAFTIYHGEDLVAALLCIEYNFQAISKYGDNKSFKGMYLCGLATHPDFRRQGIMGKLMVDAEKYAKEKGCHMTFLIPADSHLREYYEKKGYLTASFKRYQIEKSNKLEGRSKMYIYTFKRLFEEGKHQLIDLLADWCREREKNDKSYISILHSKMDFITIMEENENSFFLTETPFNPEYPILAKVRAVVFPEIPDNKNMIWKISGLFLKENDILDSNLEKVCLPEDVKDTLKSIHPDLEIALNLPYTGRDRKCAHPYAMVKPVNKNENYEFSDHHIFNISLMLD